MTRTEDQRAPEEGMPEGPVEQTEPYALTLFVSGASSLSALAIANVTKFCARHLRGRHELRIVDLNQEPALAAEHHVLATPTLIKERPPPTLLWVGDMSDHDRLLHALNEPARPLVGFGPGHD